MSRRSLPLFALLATLVLTSAALQKRVQTAEAEDFPAIMKSASAAWEANDFGACVAHLKKATGLANEKRSEAIRAALPAAPAGWMLEPAKKNPAENAMAAALGGAIGNVTQANYREEGGRGSISVSIMSDSPMIQMFNMWASNPAMLGENAELIEYEAHRAVLKKESSGLSLQILIHKKHMCDVKVRGLDEDAMFKMFDQATIDKLAAILGK